MATADPTDRPNLTTAPHGAADDVPFRDAFDGMQLGVTISDPSGRIIYVNPALAAMHGYAPHQLIGQPAFILGARSARQTLTSESLSAVRRWQRETLNAKQNGETFPVQLMSDVLEDESGHTIGIVTICEDIGERKRREEEESRSALRDPLTGLASRTFFLQLVDRVAQRRKRHPAHRFAVLYLDIDRFALINDSLGHEAGDELLAAVAERLTASVRPSDVVARIAGDEFAVLLDDIQGNADGTRVAERIIAGLDTPFQVKDDDVYVTVSIGIALSDAGHEQTDQYLADASSAAQRARAHGESPYEIFDRSVHKRAAGRLRLETELRQAIERKEFRVVYQPIIDLTADRIAGFEALVRWMHPTRGLVSPGEFIPVAEETGLIVPIGSWVMNEACRQLTNWRGRFPHLPELTINVNLSPRHLRQSDVVEEVLLILGETGLPPERLKLEITETMLMEDAESQLEVLRELRRAGVGIAIDDFGTGYSSLSYLRRFSVNSLKIDQSFLAGSSDEEAWEIVRMIIGLARGMGVSVVAEGVETEEQKLRLTGLACDLAQGYLFARPLDAEKAEQFLSPSS